MKFQKRFSCDPVILKAIFILEKSFFVEVISSELVLFKVYNKAIFLYNFKDLLVQNKLFLLAALITV